jgi:hypothetical protein
VQKGTTMDDTALDKLLEEYRDALGVYSDRRNELHRDACVEVWKMRADLARLQAIEAAARDTLNDIKDNWYIENLQPGGVAESDVSVDHILALAAALSASPQPPQPGDGDGAG